MSEIAIWFGETACMAAAEARWITYGQCFRLDLMEQKGSALIIALVGLLILLGLLYRDRAKLVRLARALRRSAFQSKLTPALSRSKNLA